MKKKLILGLALLFLIINTVPAFAYVWALSLLRFGANSAWVAGGARTLSVLVKAKPTGVTSGVIPLAKTAWVAVTKNKSTLAQFAIGTIGSAGLAAAGSELYNNWDTYANSVAAALGWVKVGDQWMKIESATGYSLSNMTAYNYYFNTTLPSLTKHQSPNIDNNMGIYTDQAAAEAAATAKRNALAADTANYSDIKPVTGSTQSLIAPATYDNTAKFRSYQAGAYNKNTSSWEWFHYNSPYPGGATLVQPQTQNITLSDYDKRIALGDSLENADAKAKAVVESSEKAANTAISAGTAATEPGWCGAGKTYQQCLDEWIAADDPTLADQVGTDGEEVPDEETEDIPIDSDLPAAQQKVIDRFTTFKNTITGSGLGGMYNNLFGSIPTSSTCEMSINLGTRFGGVHTISFCSWGTALSMIASVMLLVSGYVAVKIILGKGNS